MKFRHICMIPLLLSLLISCVGIGAGGNAPLGTDALSSGEHMSETEMAENHTGGSGMEDEPIEPNFSTEGTTAEEESTEPLGDNSEAPVPNTEKATDTEEITTAEAETSASVESTEPTAEIQWIPNPFTKGPKSFAYVYGYETDGGDRIWHDYTEKPIHLTDGVSLERILYGSSDACFWKQLPSNAREQLLLVYNDGCYYLFMGERQLAVALDLPSGITLDPDNFMVIIDAYTEMPTALAIKNDAGLVALFSLYQNKLVTDFIYHSPHFIAFDDTVLMFKEEHTPASLEYLEAPSIVNDLRSVVDGTLLASLKEDEPGWFMSPYYNNNSDAHYYVSRYAYTGGPDEPGHLYTYSKTENKFLRLGQGMIYYPVVMNNGEIWYIPVDSYVPTADKRTFLRYDQDGTQLTVPENEYLWHALDVFDGMLLAIGTDGYVHITDLEGNLLKTICKWEENMYYNSDISGYYSKSEGHKEGLYLIFDSAEGMFEYGYIFGEEELYYAELDPMDFAYAKPVLYLYPEKECKVDVSLLHDDRITVSYPKYPDSGWSVTAQPDGTLTDGEREYYCLYWEEEGQHRSAFAEGFCIAGKDSSAFLEDALAKLGLTEREANECIIYWLPILESSPYNVISFECTEEREAKSPLLITPTPDTLIRVALHILPSDTFVSLPAQTLTAPARVGFVAVEWGGMLYTK